MTPNAMPRKGSPLTTVRRERLVPCDVERDTHRTCCGITRTEKVPAVKRKPRTIRNTQMADQLKEMFK